MIGSASSIQASEIDAAFAATLEATGVPAEALVAPSRKRRIVRARHAAAAVLRHRWGLSYPELGAIFGDRDPTTMIHSVRVADPALVVEINELIDAAEIAGPIRLSMLGGEDRGYCLRCGLTSWHWAGCPEARS